MKPPDEDVRPAAVARRRHPVVRAALLLAAIGAALLMASLSVDLGPSLRARAERAGSNYIQRPIHIGRLSVRLLSGTFIVEDLVIDGLNPGDQPFLRARRIAVHMPWWTIFGRQLIVDTVDMTDWDMRVEQFANGRHSFPKFTHESTRTGPKRFTTTVRQVNAIRGRFTYDDHGSPWSVVAPNLRVSVFRGYTDYRGIAEFSKGTIAIQSYRPFTASMQSRFKIDGGHVLFDRVDLETDGARTQVNGVVDTAHWPEQRWNVHSRVDFPIQKAIFFKADHFDVSGHGDFTGTFHLFKGGRELKGTFTSPEAGVNLWRFPNTRGSLLWIPSRFEVRNVTTDLYGGRATFDYTMGPFGHGQRARAVWDASYQRVDLAQISDFLDLQGLRLAGTASGRNRLEWPLGRFAEKRGAGTITVAPPPGVQPMTRSLSPNAIARVDPLPPEVGPFNGHAPLGYVPIAGEVGYGLDQARITLARGWAATDRTYVEFSGDTAWGQHSHVPFHVTSLDWQESDRLLAGIMTAFGSPTGAVAVGGRGVFDGVMTEAFTRPRIEGRFEGERMRAWDVVWGHGRADLVIQNGYVTIAGGVVDRGPSRILADGRFSLGYPRKDGGEEIDATVRISRRPVVDLRRAFGLDDYPVEGDLSGEYRLTGMYESPFGSGRLIIDRGRAYGETFEHADSNLHFEGTGVRLEGIELHKSTGQVTGAAFVGWDSTYSFNADGRRIPVESLVTLVIPRAPLSGLLQFTATGAGSFDSPRYDVRVRVNDLFARDEGIGQVTGRIGLRADTLTLEVEAASPRLAVSGSGRISLTPQLDTEMTLTFTDTSLDPYLRFFQPRLSPFTTAVADGTIRAVGELADLNHLSVEATVDRLNLKLFDYGVHNDGPIDLSLDQRIVRVRRLRLSGEGTALELTGHVGLDDSGIALDASGDANLSILQGIFRDIRSSGKASLHAEVRGPIEKPVFAGEATVSDGRIRYFGLPHSLDAINGHVSFDAQGIRMDGLSATVGGGHVQFGGRIALDGFSLGQLNLTAAGEQMHLRYPEGFRSVVDADLALRGDFKAPLLSGTVTVRDAVWTRRFEPDADVFNFGGGGGGAAAPVAAAPASAFPLRFDLQVHAPSSLRVENNLARVTSSADLTLAGTYDKPLLFGRADIERGEVFFEGNRYVVTRGTIDFFNPSRIEPFFDIEAETRIRVPEDSYRVTLNVTGTMSGRLNLQLNSDPPLPTVDILSLLFGQTTDVGNAELRSLQPQAVTQSEEALLRAGLARVFAAPIAGPVGRVVEQTLGIDTVQISPSLGTETDPLAPTARLIIGKRLSNRAYLTFSSALGTSQRDQVIVLEYDQTDRLGWILTQNGDRTFAVEFRVRHTF